MRETTSKNKQRLTTAIVIVLFLFLLVSFLRVFLRDYELRHEIGRLQTDVNKLEKRKIESLEVLKKLQSDSYAEGRAREELLAAKPGESVLVVPGLSVTGTATKSLTLEKESPTELSNVEKWWYYFFGNVKSQ